VGRTRVGCLLPWLEYSGNDGFGGADKDDYFKQGYYFYVGLWQ
jgi:hypothetical protein